MNKVFRLEEYVLYYLVKNLENLLNNEKFVKNLSKYKLPYGISNRLFDEVERYSCGINDKLLKIFCEEYMTLTEIRLNDVNIDDRESFEALRNLQLRSLVIKSIYTIQVEDLINIVAQNTVTELVINQADFRSENYLFDRLERRRNKYALGSTVNESFPKLANVEKLDLQSANISDVQFYYFTKYMTKVVDLNISLTSISELRLIKKFRKLKFLDCTRLHHTADQFCLVFQFLPELEYLRFGYPSTSKTKQKLIWSNHVNDFLKNVMDKEEQAELTRAEKKFNTKKSWSFSEFLEMLLLKNLKFVECIKNWDTEISSVK